MEVTCTKARQEIDSGNISEDSRTHIDGCQACQIAERIGALDQQGALERDTARYDDAPPLKTQRSRLLLVLTGIATAIVAVTILTRPDLVDVAPTFYGLILGLSVAFLGLVALATRPMFKPESPSLTFGVASFALAAVFAPVLLMESSFQLPPHVSETFIHFRCFFVGFSVVIPFLLLGLWQQTNSRSTYPTFLLFLGGAVLGNLVLLLHCPLSTLSHQLCGHATLVPIGMLVAAILVFRPKMA